jgi:DNA polymerase-3 subunit gamma/tau
MASQVLYLKWRPQRFEEVVGQEHITRTLQNALRSERIAHAYLFAGPRGTGKTTMARLLAKAVNCLDEDVNNRPCNQCHICRSINEGRLLDLIEMDAASHTGVDNVREAIREKVGFRPNEARYKVYVIDEVHMLSTSAFNALLKTLEEPPEHVIFCLATTEPHKILPTIISRCQRFDFRRIPVSALVTRLQTIVDQEGLQVEEEALRFVARLSTGCARDAISLLDQLTAYGDQVITIERIRSVLGLGDAQMVHDLVAHLAARDIGRGLDVINQAVQGGVDARQFAQQVLDYLRSLLLMRVGSLGNGGLGSAALDLDAQTRAGMRPLAEQLSTRDLVRAIKLLNQAQLDLRGSDQNQLALELAFVEAALAEEEQAAVTRLPPVPAKAATSQPKTSTGAPAAARGSVRSRPLSPPRPAPEPDQGVLRTGSVSQAERPEPFESVQPGAAAVAVTMEEVDAHWTEIRHAIRSQSRQAEALVNSAFIRGIQDQVRIVFEFPSKLLAEKLEKVETKRLVEEAIHSVLGKPCRVQGVVAGQSPSPGVGQERNPIVSPPEAVEPAMGDTQSEPAKSEPEQARNFEREVLSDPLVQELQDLGGKVTKVERRAASDGAS